MQFLNDLLAGWDFGVPAGMGRATPTTNMSATGPCAAKHDDSAKGRLPGLPTAAWPATIQPRVNRMPFSRILESDFLDYRHL
jgi:hypothetical protein